MPPLAFTAGLTQGANVLRETGNRIVRIPEIAGSLAGARGLRKLRIRVAILCDEQGKPVATPEDVEPSLAEATRSCARRWRSTSFRRWSPLCG